MIKEKDFSSVDAFYDNEDEFIEDENTTRSQMRSNHRKSETCLFIYLILVENTDSNHPMNQKTIQKELLKDPYELKIERQAIGRILHGLEQERIGIQCNKGGYWYDEQKRWNYGQ